MKIDAKKVALGRSGRWYIEDEKLMKMTVKMGLECREVNMILKLDQYAGNRGVHSYVRHLEIQRNGAEDDRVIIGNHREKD